MTSRASGARMANPSPTRWYPPGKGEGRQDRVACGETPRGMALLTAIRAGTSRGAVCRPVPGRGSPRRDGPQGHIDPAFVVLTTGVTPGLAPGDTSSHGSPAQPSSRKEDPQTHKRGTLARDRCPQTTGPCPLSLSGFGPVFKSSATRLPVLLASPLEAPAGGEQTPQEVQCGYGSACRASCWPVSPLPAPAGCAGLPLPIVPLPAPTGYPGLPLPIPRLTSKWAFQDLNRRALKQGLHMHKPRVPSQIWGARPHERSPREMVEDQGSHRRGCSRLQEVVQAPGRLRQWALGAGGRGPPRSAWLGVVYRGALGGQGLSAAACRGAPDPGQWGPPLATGQPSSRRTARPGRE